MLQRCKNITFLYKSKVNSFKYVLFMIIAILYSFFFERINFKEIQGISKRKAIGD